MSDPAQDLADKFDLHLKIDSDAGFYISAEDMGLIVKSLRALAQNNYELASLRSRLEEVGELERHWIELSQDKRRSDRHVYAVAASALNLALNKGKEDGQELRSNERT